MKKIAESLVVFILLAILVYFGRPKMSAFYNNKGIQYYNQSLYKEAMLCFKKSLQIYPSSITHCNMANSYMALKNTDEAIKEYKKSIQAKPENAEPYLGLSQAYLSTREYEKALDALNKAETEFATEAEIEKIRKNISFEYALAAANKGIDKYMAGEKSEAYGLLNKALKIDPGSLYPYYFLGYVYAADDDLSSAKNMLEKALSIDPDFLSARTLLGDTYYNKGFYEKAISEYKTGLSVNFDNALLHNNIGLSFMNMELYGKAIAHLEKALEVSPDNLNIRYTLASVYRDKGLLDQAVTEYKKVLSHLPGYPHAHNDLGDIYIKQEKKEAALKEYLTEIENCKKKLKVNSLDVNALNDLAYAYNSVGEYIQAEKTIKRAVKLRPSWREAYLTLAKIEENLGNNGEALNALNKAKSLSTYSGFIDKDILRLKRSSGLSAKKTSLLDKIYLTNGRIIEGTIMEETDERIVLEIHVGKSQGLTIITRDKIKNIVKAK